MCLVGHHKIPRVMHQIIFVDFTGKEVIIQYSTTLNTEGNFYTDANGRQMMLRKRFFFVSRSESFSWGQSY